jgi:hypothetical protein
MGVSGSGNFENDSALDYIGDVVKNHINEVEQIINSNVDGSGFGVEDTDVIMAAIEVIIALCEKCYAVPPKLQLIENWKRLTLEVYDNEIDELRPDPDYKIERRQVINDTFEKLEKLSQQWNT